MSRKLALVLMVLAAACGGAVQRNSLSRDAVPHNDATAECSLSLGRVNADAIQRAVHEAGDGSLDPCSGSLAQRDAYEADLARVDESPDGYVTLVFWMRLLHPEDPRPLRP